MCRVIMSNILIIEKDQKIAATVLLDNTGVLKLEKIEEEFKADIKQRLHKIKNEGAELRQCTQTNDKIIETLAVVKPNETNYFAALEDEFVRAGFRTAILDQARAELWELVRASNTDLAFQEAVLRNIHILKDDLIPDIKKEFLNYRG